uniref:Zinc finger GRF-type domain-containing protein n=1 Tax=Leersia perrieri TaxID=77586 RepID=A0A0D9XY33_9ORYZ
MTSDDPQTCGRRYFQCPNYALEVYGNMCDYIEWVDTENPVFDRRSGRWMSPSESDDMYLARKTI